ncbi:hypothetical protein CR205_02845 [Alteribacter lacisalsi]|uniref:Methyltransferase domain-containing protein n=1 Tax=Alteribacter lacisalsi TaxID=2045244 RepID=A0A2W0H9E7_9BACI|nr:class I SAM-dependent methyltransferase [Alteribacter lacisalsi]PYZ97551.1 hypothetical protein CR205_02845 [Alteribacter lacisalsi]
MNEGMLAKVWEKSALYYDMGMIRRSQAEWDDALMQLITSPGGLGLDLGTGDGKWAFALERIGFDTISLDSSETRIKKADHLRALQKSRCEFAIGDIKNPPFSEQTFNVVTTRLPFWEWTDAPEFLFRIRKQLNNRGTFLSLEETSSKGKLRVDLSRALLEYAGFKKTVCREVIRRTHYRFEDLAVMMKKNRNELALSYHQFAGRTYSCAEMNDLFRELGLDQWYVSEEEGIRYFEKRTPYMAVAGYKEEEINLRNFENVVDNDSHLQ